MNLFVVDEYCEKLSKEKSETFHNIVAKMLLATKRTRQDTGTSIYYLMTRVKEPDQSDWMNMAHILKYVRGTKDTPIIRSTHKSGMLKWYIDRSHVVHTNMRGNTGGGLTMGKVFPIWVWSKQKLNTRSSIESEMFGVDQLMP